MINSIRTQAARILLPREEPQKAISYTRPICFILPDDALPARRAAAAHRSLS